MTTTLTALNNQIKTGELGFHDTLEDGTRVDTFLADELAIITAHYGQPNIWQTTGKAATKLGINERTLRSLLRAMDRAMQDGTPIHDLILEFEDLTDEQCRTFKLSCETVVINV